ncbi:hypothetical protein [Actinoplanes auranticolor]|uniref:Uncharacterized protein n=1 Tax=Actinoplanes auranticolor TaxID=47988 RepID=A0A919SHN7_9ACTN|nr:hypothetical protein [Actinoplanes auranticolor]GIM72151.1 hypothetical protein Aau02nite_49560 [Actinoplanes auranticolor]
MEQKGVSDVVGVLGRANSIAASLQLTYRKAHASHLMAACDGANQLARLVDAMEKAVDVGAAEDWELRRLVHAIRGNSRGLRGDLDRAFNRTIRRGPGSVRKLDERVLAMQALLLRALERASELQQGTNAVSTEKVCVGVETRWHHSVPVGMIRLALRLMPLLHQGRYIEEWMGELVEHRSWFDKFDYACFVLIGVRSHRRQLVDGAAYRAKNHIE